VSNSKAIASGNQFYICLFLLSSLFLVFIYTHSTCSLAVNCNLLNGLDIFWKVVLQCLLIGLYSSPGQAFASPYSA
jgi:hypothetical protein